MKHTLLFAALSAALLFSNSAEAQIPGVSKVTKMLPKVDLGIKAGGNFQDLSKNSTFKNSYAGGFVGGIFFGVTKNKIGVQAEALVKTVKYTVSISNNSINAIYIDVPVLFEYRLVPRLWLQAGPQFSDMLSAKNGSNDVKKNFNTSDFAGVLGLEAKLPAHIIVGARYLLGFTDINNKSVPGATDAWHNRSIQLYVGFRFI
jgi:hypothetical protein